MTDPLTEEQFLAGARVLHALAPETCKACDGTGVISREQPAHDPTNHCPQCHGAGTVSMLDRLAKAVGLARHPGEQDDALRGRISAHFWGHNRIIAAP